MDDELLIPHIRGAVSLVQARLRDRVVQESETGRIQEAMGCFAMAFALPVLNTFYLSQAEHVPRTVATTDYVFCEPGDVLKLVQHWESRGYEILRDVGRSDGTVSATVI